LSRCSLKKSPKIVCGAKSPRARKAGTGTAKKPRCQSLFFADVLLKKQNGLFAPESKFNFDYITLAACGAKQKHINRVFELRVRPETPLAMKKTYPCSTKPFREKSPGYAIIIKERRGDAYEMNSARMRMKRIKLYIETSVWNFLFTDDAPDKKRYTELFFEEIRKDDYELYISGLVMAEILRAPEPKRTMLMEAIEQYQPEELLLTNEIYSLARKYLESGFVPPKALDDLIHAAAATVNNMDFLVSWNLSHIVRAKSIMGITKVNIFEGYRDIRICTVLEVLPDD
jgi:hypothetical protein